MLIAKVNCKMAKQAIFLIILCLNSCSTFSAKTEKCDDNTTKTTGGTAYWKFRGVRYTTSEDYLCWKENWELFLRECNTATGQWHPENVVCQEQEETNQYCPEELIEIHGDNGDPLCLHISPEPQKYDDAFCRGSNVVVPSDLSKDQMSNLVQFLQKRKIKEYWLPLRRENNTMPFKIRLPGKHWGEIYDDGVETLDFTSNRCCMSAQYDSKAKKKNKSKQKDMPEMKIQDCEALLHSICIFQDELVTGSGCPQGFGALSYGPNECYGVNWSELEPLPEGRTQISIKEYFRNRNTLRRVLKKSMPKKMRDEFFQVDNFVSRSGDNYMILMNQNERVKVADKSSEIFPILHKEVVDIAPNTVQLILKIDVQKLILIVYNRGYLWRTDKDDAGVNCFTNSGYDLVQSTKVELKWESESQAKSIFKVKLVGDGPGEYWCEGHTIQNFNLVSTTRVVAVKERRGHAYAIRLSVPCELEIAKWCDNVHKNAKRMAKHIREVLREGSSAVSRDLIIFNVRIMSIEKTAPEHVDCWIHLTASLKHSAVDNSEEESGEEDNSLENDEHIRHDTSIRMQIWMLLRNLISISVYNPSSPSARIVRSTEYCFPETFHSANGEVYQWNQAARGQMGTLSRLCLQSSGLPYMRQCQGDFLHGAHWEELEGIVACQHEQENTSITKTLYSLEHSKLLRSSPEMAVREVKSILKKYASNISPADIHFTANILQSSVKYIDQHVLGLSKNISALKDTTHDLIAIYNFMVDVKKTTIQMSASLNSTNKLLEAFENAMNTLSSQAITEDDGPNRSAGHGNSAEVDSSTDFEVLDFVDIGVTLKASHNLLYFILNPTIANVSGIAMFKYDNSSENSNQIKLKGAFQMESVNFLQSTHDVTDFINKENLQFATYVPEKLLTHLDTISNALNVTEKHETIIVIKVYSNDILFQQQNSQDHRSAFGRVVSISLPGHSTQLPEDLPLVFRAWRNASLKDNSSTKPCSYWNFENWVSDGIRVSSDPNITQDIVFCQVSHLTPFAYLVGFNFTVEDDIGVSIRQVHAQALDIITIIGCSLSLLGISGIFITAAKFQSWRQKASSKVLLQLSASIALQMVILCFVSTKENSLHLIINEIISSCVAIGALLHYSVLVQFFWMMVIAYLQFKRYVQVFGRTRPTRFFIKSTAFCWGVPLIPVILVALLDHDSFSKGSICYPSGYALYFGIILPICVIIIANFIIFCLIIYNILLSSNPPIRHTEKPVLMYQIRLSVLLFFLLGFTWCFGILTIMKAGLIFSYFFCLTATLQGFVIFLYFIILDPVTRRMWSQYFYKLCSIDKGALQSTTSLKDTTQTS